MTNPNEHYDTYDELVISDGTPGSVNFKVGDRVLIGLVKKLGTKGWRRTDRVPVEVTAVHPDPEGVPGNTQFHGKVISSTYFDPAKVGTIAFWPIHVLPPHEDAES